MPDPVNPVTGETVASPAAVVSPAPVVEDVVTAEDFTHEEVGDDNPPPSRGELAIRSVDDRREDTRSQLALYLVWLLGLSIGGILAFVGLGRIEGTAVTQSVLPSVVALVGTALGFYFGSQTSGQRDASKDVGASI